MPNFLADVDLNKSQLKQARVQNLASAPSSPVVGQVYYDTVTSQLLTWNGSAWTANATLLNNHADTYLLARANHTGTQAASTISDLASVVKAYRLDEFAAPNTDVSLNSHKITGLATPSAATDAATKAYVDAVSTGLDVKASVRVASTATVTVTYSATGGTSGRGQMTNMPNTLDGVSLAGNDRVLLKNQSTAAQNGIWVVSTLGSGANGVWDRATDFDADAEVTTGAFTFVEEGTANGASSWLLTTHNPIIIGGGSGTSLVFAQFGAGSSYTAGDGLTLTGSAFAVGAGTGIAVSAGTTAIDTAVVARKGASNLTGSSTSYTVAHGAGSADVIVQVVEVATGKVVFADVSLDSTNITIAFTVAPSSNAYRVLWTF